MKKVLSAFFISFILGFATNITCVASESLKINDITDDYWAKKEIEISIVNSFMTLDKEGKFSPKQNITRIEFVQALLKILSNDNLDVTIKNSFSDVTEKDSYFADVLRSEQLGLVYGYPDGTFRPKNYIQRAEVMSVISHITKERYVDCSILQPFKDREAIPDWAKIPCAKSINYGIFVNHPDEKLLEPNRNITREEVAVILSKLKDKFEIVKPEYIGVKEYDLAVEHLNIDNPLISNTVKITNLKKVINKDNVLEVAFLNDFKSKEHEYNDKIDFIFENNLYTNEGTLLFPAGTKIIAQISKIEKAKLFKNAKISMTFNEMLQPDGKIISIDAKPYSKDFVLKKNGCFLFGRNYNVKKDDTILIILNNDIELK